MMTNVMLQYNRYLISVSEATFAYMVLENSGIPDHEKMLVLSIAIRKDCTRACTPSDKMTFHIGKLFQRYICLKN